MRISKQTKFLTVKDSNKAGIHPLNCINNEKPNGISKMLVFKIQTWGSLGGSALLVPAFGPGHDPGVPGSSPASGS